MKKFLFLASSFPPLTSGATPVIMNVSRYMPEAGWEMVPITVSNPRGLPFDSTLEDMLPEYLDVTRVYHPDLTLIAGKLRACISGKSHACRSDTKPAPLRIAASNNPLLKFLRDYVLVPDRLITWLPFVVPAGVRLAEEKKAEVIVSFGPHHSMHIIAGVIAQIAGIPLVLFFGDLWLNDSNVSWPNKLNRRIEARLEKYIVEHADGIAATTSGSTGYFKETYGTACPPTHVVENGYNPEQELPEKGNPALRDFLLITCTGNFFSGQSPVNIYRGLRLFLDRHPDAPVKVRLIGKQESEYYDLLKTIELSSNLELIDTVPFRDVPCCQIESDVLLASLVDVPGSELKNSSKLAEYLRTGKPILAIAPEGDMTNYVRTLEAGYVAKPSPEGFAETLEDVFNDWRKGALHGVRRWKAMEEIFNARNIMKRFGAFLDGIVSGDRE
ncbi:MAG: glycosyltransferase [Candidatus Aegiribacteria sp.]|nr:glycosyltransferase [Candidatus Aegiribacteria sp.]